MVNTDFTLFDKQGIKINTKCKSNEIFFLKFSFKTFHFNFLIHNIGTLYFL